jgi:SAM-dependent methyltransferase
VNRSLRDVSRVRIPTEESQCELCASSGDGVPVAAGWDFEYNTTHEEFLFVRCARCGLIYLKERPAPEAMRVIYPPHYYSYVESKAQKSLVGAIRSKLERGKIRAYLGLLGEGKKSVLDIGCGDGRLLDIMASACPATWEFAGIEVSEKAAARAREKGYGIMTGDFETAEVSGLGEPFDLALMHQVIEHTRSPRKAIQKARALLKNGGVISIETPDTESWDWMLFRKRYWGGYHTPRHFYLFSKGSLCRLLEEEGFEILSCKSLLSPVFWIHSLHNYRNPLLLSVATAIDVLQITFSERSSNMQVLARKKVDGR